MKVWGLKNDMLQVFLGLYKLQAIFLLSLLSNLSHPNLELPLELPHNGGTSTHEYC